MTNEQLIQALLKRGEAVGKGEYTRFDDIFFLRAINIALGNFRLSSGNPYVGAYIDSAKNSLRNAIYHEAGEANWGDAE